MPRDKRIRTILLIVGMVVIALTMICMRAFYGSMRAYHQGETYSNEGQYMKAITFLDRSMHWYAPFNPYIHHSAERLWEIGLAAEQRGDIPVALIAFRSIRRGFYAARSFYTPGRDWITKCDAKISQLIEIGHMNNETPRGSVGPDESIPGSQEATGPSTVWSIIVEIGFLGWIASVIGLLLSAHKGKQEARFLTGPLPAGPARKGGVKRSYNKMVFFLTPKPRAEARRGLTSRAITWGALTLIFFTLWLVGMMKA